MIDHGSPQNHMMTAIKSKEMNHALLQGNNLALRFIDGLTEELLFA